MNTPNTSSAAASSASAAPANASQDKVMVIGAGFTIEGHVQGHGTLLVSGTVKGVIQADTVKLSETAHVSGRIECKELDMAGRLDGHFQSTDVVVRAGAVVISEEESVSTGICLVAGAISGALQSNQLKVETSGQIRGPINATQMDVHGHVQGEVNALDLIVRSTGTIDGRVVYGDLSMERGSDVSGQLQRKDRQNTHTAAKADETVVIHLPVNIVQQLRKKPNSLQLSLANGDPQPGWISVDLEHAWLVLGKKEFNQLLARCETITLRLQAGNEDLVFTLPPDAQ